MKCVTPPSRAFVVSRALLCFAFGSRFPPFSFTPLYCTVDPHPPTHISKSHLRLLLLPLLLGATRQGRLEHRPPDEARDEAHEGREQDGGARDGVVPRGEEAVEGGAVPGVDEGLCSVVCVRGLSGSGLVIG